MLLRPRFLLLLIAIFMALKSGEALTPPLPTFNPIFKGLKVPAWRSCMRVKFIEFRNRYQSEQTAAYHHKRTAECCELLWKPTYKDWAKILNVCITATTKFDSQRECDHYFKTKFWIEQKHLGNSWINRTAPGTHGPGTRDFWKNLDHIVFALGEGYSDTPINDFQYCSDLWWPYEDGVRQGNYRFNVFVMDWDGLGGNADDKVTELNVRFHPWRFATGKTVLCLFADWMNPQGLAPFTCEGAPFMLKIEVDYVVSKQVSMKTNFWQFFYENPPTPIKNDKWWCGATNDLGEETWLIGIYGCSFVSYTPTKTNQLQPRTSNMRGKSVSVAALLTPSVPRMAGLAALALLAVVAAA